VVRSRSQNVVLGGCLGALVLGFIGFAAGFFGPIILAPEANQGPLIGIFLTGPLGVVAGAIIGAVVGWRRGSGEP
jgi:hypothetical protein